VTGRRRALVLRPAPADARTVALLAAAGVTAQAVPLFVAGPLAWTVPAGRFDALLLTSANAIRHGGAGLRAVAHLPVVAVGAATAAAARAAGFAVVLTGDGDVAAAVRDAGDRRLLHLAGRDHVAAAGVAGRAVVYASDPVPAVPGMVDAAVDGVVLLHSRRAARRFAEVAGALPRDRIRLAALSPAVAAAAGTGWRRVEVAARPTDAALVDVAARLAIDP
jgi:uroporphyrinogen-III synthase